MGVKLTGAGGGAASDAFTIIQTPEGTAPTADSATDTLTFTSSGGTVTITGNSTTDTINFEAADGGVTVGDAIADGTNNRLLYQDSSGELAQSENARFEGGGIFTEKLYLAYASGDADPAAVAGRIQTKSGTNLSLKSGSLEHWTFKSGGGYKGFYKDDELSGFGIIGSVDSSAPTFWHKGDLYATVAGSLLGMINQGTVFLNAYRYAAIDTFLSGYGVNDARPTVDKNTWKAKAASGPITLDADHVVIKNSVTPASASATGVAGTIAWDADYIYVCTATNTWKRTAIATW